MYVVGCRSNSSSLRCIVSCIFYLDLFDLIYSVLCVRLAESADAFCAVIGSDSQVRFLFH
jgi:hypothetical protein